MSTTREVISAFMDDEPFDGQELAVALSEPEGRELLLDLVALRHLAQPNVAPTSVPGMASQRPSTLRMALAAAAVVVAWLAAISPVSVEVRAVRPPRHQRRESSKLRQPGRTSTDRPW